MLKQVRWLVVAAALLAGGLGRAEEGELESISARVGPSVVRIADMDGDEELGSGSGFFVADGVVVTNHHVIGEVDGQVFAVFRDGKKVRVLGLLADDQPHDLALLRIEGKGYPALPLAPSAGIGVGERVVALGSPMGFDQTVSSGIISAIRADYPPDWKKQDEYAREHTGPLVQHTAPIAPGSSGSPLVDLQGRVVGINHSSIENTSMYFAAHVDLLRALLARTRLDARPRALGPNVRRNLVISAAFVAVVVLGIALWFGLARRRTRRRFV